MKKRIFFTILGILLLIGALAGIKYLQINKMIAAGAQHTMPPTTVTAAAVQNEQWDSLLSAVGSLTAVQGVTVSAELAGKVVSIHFEAGDRVAKGDLLISQDTTSERAQLPGAEANVTLTKLQWQRMKELLAEKVVAQSEYDTAEANYRQAVATAENIRASIAKKKVRAPFAGRLGIRQVNLGQILKEGDQIVSLQTLDPIFVDFLLPQQQLASIRPGLTIRLTTDALPGETLNGKITAINPEVDSTTRNIKVQGTISNPKEALRPGMYVNVEVVLPQPQKVLAIPATSVLYAPYSDSVFVVEEKKDEKTGKTGKVLRQQFVRLGEKRGDFVAIASGLKGDETVVTTGVFKLRNGQSVVEDNKLAPQFKLEPKPKDD